MPLPLANQIHLQVQNGRADEIGRLGKSGDVKSTEHAKGTVGEKVASVFGTHKLEAKTISTRDAFADAVMAQLQGKHIQQQHLQSSVLDGISSKLSFDSNGCFNLPSGAKINLTLGQADYLLRAATPLQPQPQSLAQKFDTDANYNRLLSQELVTTFGPDFTQAIFDSNSNFYDTSPQMVSAARFTEIKPPLHSAVILSNNKPIHANRIVIDGRGLGIATQAPTANTLNEFWQMVSEQKTQLIVDLTNAKDRTDRAIPDYLPTDIYRHPDRQFGVEGDEPLHDSFDDTPSIVKETYKVVDANGERPLVSLHFTEWPDHGVISVEELQDLVKQVQGSLDKFGANSSPIVHCNAGVGRSGTLLSALSLHKDFNEQKLTKSNCNDRVLQTIVEGKLARGAQFVQTAAQARLVAEFAHSLFNQRAL
jgi:protein tyrosine phosphatase